MADVFMALLSFRGFDTPSLPAQGEQRRSTYFNIGRDIPPYRRRQRRRIFFQNATHIAVVRGTSAGQPILLSDYDSTLQHPHQKRDTKTCPRRQGSRNGRSSPKFRTQRPSQSRETARYGRIRTYEFVAITPLKCRAEFRQLSEIGCLRPFRERAARRRVLHRDAKVRRA
jgi:hypothetical protein